MNETTFENEVVALARRHGWRVAGTARTGRGTRTPIRHDSKGLPDLMLSHAERGCLVFAELKVGNNTTSDDQDAWLDDLHAVELRMHDHFPPMPVRVFVWHPDDVVEIADVLSFGTEPDWQPT